MALLKKIKMASDAPYHSLQPAANYVNEFKEAVQWINGTEYRLTDKQLAKQFLRGIQPAKLREQLELLEI